MVTGFTEETKSISKDEKRAAKLISKELKKHTTKEFAINSDELLAFANASGFNLDGARLRKVINYIRNKRLVSNLVACSKGYYVSKDPVEIKKYINSLTQRAHAILQVRNSFAVNR